MVSGFRTSVRNRCENLWSVIHENKLLTSLILSFSIAVVPTVAIVVIEDVIESPAPFSLDLQMIELLLLWITMLAGFLTPLFFGLISSVTTAKCLIHGGPWGTEFLHMASGLTVATGLFLTSSWVILPYYFGTPMGTQMEIIIGLLILFVGVLITTFSIYEDAIRQWLSA